MNNAKLQGRLNTKHTDLLLSWGNDYATLRKLLKLLYAYGYHFVGRGDFDADTSVDDLRNAVTTAFFNYYHGNSKPLLHVFYNPITGKNEMQLTNLTNIRTYPQYRKVKVNYFRIKHPACFVVGADNEQDAMRIAEEELTRMSKAEIVRRLVDALDFDFVVVERVTEFDL